MICISPSVFDDGIGKRSKCLFRGGDRVGFDNKAAERYSGLGGVGRLVCAARNKHRTGVPPPSQRTNLNLPLNSSANLPPRERRLEPILCKPLRLYETRIAI